MRVAGKRMRIAALQYANGQVKHCDDLIEASQCFSHVFLISFCNIPHYKHPLNTIRALHLYAALIPILRKLCIFAEWNGYIIYFLHILPYRQWW